VKEQIKHSSSKRFFLAELKLPLACPLKYPGLPARKIMRRKPFVQACTFILLTATVFNSAHGAGHFNNGKLSRDERLLPRPYQVSFGNNADIYTLGAVGLTISPDSFGKTQDSKLQNNFVVATVERFKRSLHLLNSTAQYRRTKYSPLRKENEEGFSRAKLHGPVHVSIEVFVKLSLNEATFKKDLQHGVDESYSLQILTDGTRAVKVQIESNTVFGTNHAFATLEQIVGRRDGYGLVFENLPVVVRDKPQFEHRGLLMDTARHYFPVQQLMRIIDGMALLKLNVFHWHIADSQSFPFQSKNAPLLGLGAFSPHAVYTRQDIRNIVSYAFSRGIEIIPEIDVPGHAASWGVGYPNITVNCDARVAEDDRLLEHGVDKVPLNPLLEETYDVVLSLLDEIFELFPSKFVHLGGDEVDDECWLSDPKIRDWKEHGPGSKFNRRWKTELHSIFFRRIAEHTLEAGKTPILWDEALDLRDLPKNTVIQLWRWWLPGQASRAQRNGKFRTISSIGYYLDYASNTWEKIYDTIVPYAQSPLTVGGEACAWNEHADSDTIENRIFGRLSAFAERFWSSPKLKRDQRLLPRLSHTICRLKKTRGLRIASLFPDYCPTEKLQLAESVQNDRQSEEL
jgi:hexosaminidase